MREDELEGGRNGTRRCDKVEAQKTGSGRIGKEKKGRNGNITEREKRFAEIYVKTLDAARAYAEAGYAAKNKHSASSAASRLRRKTEIKQYIGELFEKVRKRNELDCDKVIELLGAIAFTSPADLGDIEEEENGEQRIKWKSFERLDEDTKRAIALIKNTRGGVEIETLDRMKAIDMLMKHLGIEKTGEGGVVIKGEEEI